MAIKLSKLFFVLLIFYYGWFQLVFFQIPKAMLILGAGMTGFIIVDAIHTRTNIFEFITPELIFWILFAFTSFVFGWLVAVDRGLLISSVSTFIQYLILIYGIIYISYKDKKINFFIIIYIIFATVCAITTISTGVVDVEGRAIMAVGGNPNSVGINMAIGICCILYLLDFKRTLLSIAGLGITVLLLYVILLSGSRKSFLSVVLIFVYWLLLVAIREIRKLKSGKRVIILILMIIVLIASYKLLYEMFKDSLLLEKLYALLQGSEDTRIGMYSEAVDIFKSSPLVGVGLDNFRAISVYGTYSHSTFAEALACTGIIGCVLYFIPYITTSLFFLKLAVNKADTAMLKERRVMLGLFAVLLFLAVGLIHFYQMTTNIAFGMLFAFRYLEMNVKEEPLEEGLQ